MMDAVRPFGHTMVNRLVTAGRILLFPAGPDWVSPQARGWSAQPCTLWITQPELQFRFSLRCLADSLNIHCRQPAAR